MSRNLVKFYNINEQEDSRVIDSNAFMEIALARAAQTASRGRRSKPDMEYADGEDMGEASEDGFFEGIDAEAFAALTADEGSIIKAVDPEKEAEEIIAAARAKADEIVATAEQLGIEFKENSRREAEIEGTRIKADAKQAGYQDGLYEAEQAYQAKMQELEMMSMTMNAEYEEMCASLESRFVETITGIYEHIFKVDLSEYKSLLAELIASTMRNVEYSKTYIIHVSSEDYQAISELNREMLNAAAPGCDVEVVEDIALGLNQCLVETDNGVFDCGLDTQLRELRKKLMLLSYNPNTES